MKVPKIITITAITAIAGAIGSQKIVADSSTGLYTGSDEISSFSTYDLSSLQQLKMETLWEKDMSKANNGEGANDANENDHNLFVIDDVVYAYLEHYKAKNKVSIYLRKINATTGEEIDNIEQDFPSDFSSETYSKMLMADDAGNLVLFGLYDNNSAGNNYKLKVFCYDTDLSNETQKLDYTSPGAFNESAHHIKRVFEWLNLSGDIANDNFKATIGGWHSYTSTSGNCNFYPSLCNLTKNSNSSDISVNITRFSTGDNIDVRTVSHSTNLTENYLYVTSVNDDYQLVQSFGTKDAPTTHSNVYLYKNDHSTTDTNFANGSYPMMTLESELTKSGLTTTDSHCFGVFPVVLGNEHLLILPYKFNSTNGTVFKIAHWTDTTTLSDDALTELWSFPNKQTFPYPGAKNIFDTERPKVVVKNSTTDNGEQQAIVYAYMPGSFLGAYKLTLTSGDQTLAGINATKDDEISFSLNNRIISIKNYQANTPINLEIYTPAGQKVYSRNVAAGNAEASTFDLTGLSSGLYLLRINNQCTKLILN